jgi:hypothetical protein
VGSTTACEPQQNLLLIIISKLATLIAANLTSAQPLATPTLIH